MHNSTLRTGEEPQYKMKNHYLNLNAEIPMSDNAHHNPQFQHDLNSCRTCQAAGDWNLLGQERPGKHHWSFPPLKHRDHHWCCHKMEVLLTSIILFQCQLCMLIVSSLSMAASLFKKELNVDPFGAVPLYWDPLVSIPGVLLYIWGEDWPGFDGIDTAAT